VFDIIEEVTLLVGEDASLHGSNSNAIPSSPPSPPTAALASSYQLYHRVNKKY
jgi:hypothetical protein